MTAIFEPTRIHITNESAETVFDTDDKLFFATDFITGTHSVPQKDQSTLLKTTTTLSACHSQATRAIGMAQVEFTVGQEVAGMPGYGWFNVSGTYLHWIDGRQSTDYYRHGNATRLFALSFFCENGSLKIEEQIVMANRDIQDNLLFTLRPFNLHYRIWCGLFDQ